MEEKSEDIRCRREEWRDRHKRVETRDEGYSAHSTVKQLDSSKRDEKRYF